MCAERDVAAESLILSHEWYPRGAMAPEALDGLVWKSAASLIITRKLANGTEEPCFAGRDYDLGGDPANGRGWCRALKVEADGTRFIAERKTARQQRKRFTRHEPIDAAEVEAGFDQAMLIDQEQDAALLRETMTRQADIQALRGILDELPPNLAGGPSPIPALRVDLGAESGAMLIGYRAPGQSLQGITVAERLNRAVFQDDYSSYAEAKAAAGGVRPLFCYPQTNAEFPGADTQIGLRIGHMVIGGDLDSIDDVDAFVALNVHERYIDIGQEVRIVSAAGRGWRTVPDEANLGWDWRISTATGVTDGRNSQYIRGNLNPFTAEWFFDRPDAPYAARNLYLYSTYVQIAQRVHVENLDCLVIKAPVGSPTEGTGTIGDMTGIVIDPLDAFIAPTGDLSAIRLRGAGDAGRIWWGNETWVLADTDGKLELGLNGRQLSCVNALVTPAAGAVLGYFDCIINGTPAKLPFHALA